MLLGWSPATLGSDPSPHFSPYSFGDRTLARLTSLPPRTTAQSGLRGPGVALQPLPDPSGPSGSLIPRASGPARGAPRSSDLVPKAVLTRRDVNASSAQQRRTGGDNRTRFACTCRNTSA